MENSHTVKRPVYSSGLTLLKLFEFNQINEFCYIIIIIWFKYLK